MAESSTEAAEATTSLTGNNAKAKASYAEVQETVSRLASHKGVTSVLILNHSGDILTQAGQGAAGNPKLLKQTLETAAMYIQSIPRGDGPDTSAANKDDDELRELFTLGEGNTIESLLDKLSFVRIRSNQEEILVAPKNEYVLVVIQDPTLAPM